MSGFRYSFRMLAGNPVFAAINGSKEFDEIAGLRSYDFDGLGPQVYWENGKIVKDNLAFKAGYHPSRHDSVVTTRDKKHPITNGLPEKGMHVADDLYAHTRGPAKNLTVLATAYSDSNHGWPTTGKHEPMLYTVRYGQGRVFVCVLGHVGKPGRPDGLTADPVCCSGFITVFQRGAEWAATGKVTQSLLHDFPTAEKTSIRKQKHVD